MGRIWIFILFLTFQTAFCNDTFTLKNSSGSLEIQIGFLKDSLKVLSTEINNLKEFRESRIEVVDAKFETFETWFGIFIGIFLLIIGANWFNTHNTAKYTSREIAEKEILKIRSDYANWKEQIDGEVIGFIKEIKRSEASKKVKP